MQVKTFRALDMREALQAVKEELGSEAVILSTQQVKTGGPIFGLFGRPMVEVTAAVDQAAPGASWEKTPERSPARPPSRFSDRMMTSLLIQPLQQGLLEIKEEVGALRRLADRPAHDHQEAEKGGGLFEEELQKLRRLVGALVKTDREALVKDLPRPLALTYDQLVQSGMDPETALMLVKDLLKNVPSRDLVRPEKVRDALHAILSGYVETAGPLLGHHSPSKAVMIVGPTGVGKTTTIAKLAALYAIKRKRKVALITLDTYRVAAVEQLRVYGNILGLSVDVALTCKDLADFLRKRVEADLILIDTAGRSPLDEAAVQELKEKSVSLNRPVEVHLVLSMTTREPDLEVIAARFARLPVHQLILSKLDETMHLGPIFNLVRRTGLPLSYLSTGQCVPDDLELAAPSRLADLILDGRSALKAAGKTLGEGEKEG